jgi:hypothetical protein
MWRGSIPGAGDRSVWTLNPKGIYHLAAGQPRRLDAAAVRRYAAALR